MNITQIIGLKGTTLFTIDLKLKLVNGQGDDLATLLEWGRLAGGRTM